jgi:hypothetical protein
MGWAFGWNARLPPCAMWFAGAALNACYGRTPTVEGTPGKARYPHIQRPWAPVKGLQTASSATGPTAVRKRWRELMDACASGIISTAGLGAVVVDLQILPCQVREDSHITPAERSLVSPEPQIAS